MQMLASVLEELFTILRGAYLIMLFSPAILCAPVCIALGYRRASWVKVCAPCSGGALTTGSGRAAQLQLPALSQASCHQHGAASAATAASVHQAADLGPRHTAGGRRGPA